MPKKYIRNCNTCKKPYEGFGKKYCSSRCQPRDFDNGSSKISPEDRYNWKGNDASYFAIHIWLTKHWGKASQCDNTECVYPRKNAARSWVHTPKRYEWALKRNRKYTSNREDYYQLCKSCHAKYDYGLQVGSLT